MSDPRPRNPWSLVVMAGLVTVLAAAGPPPGPDGPRPPAAAPAGGIPLARLPRSGRLLVSDADLAAARARCLPCARPAAFSAPWFDRELPIFNQWPRSDRGRLAHVYDRYRAAVRGLMADPARDGFLAAVAFCHLIEGQPGVPDDYTRYVEAQVQARLRATTAELDVVLALDWCFEAISPALRRELADTWARNALPLTTEVSPLLHPALSRRLVHLAGALVLAGRPESAPHEAKIRAIIAAAAQYPLVSFFHLRGSTPTTPEDGLDQMLDGWVFFELLRSGLGDNRWPAVADSLGGSLNQTYWLQLLHPAANGRSFPKDGGQLFPNTGVPDPSGLRPASPFVLAARADSPTAAYFADQFAGGLLTELHRPLTTRPELMMLTVSATAPITLEPFGILGALPRPLWASPIEDALAAALRDPIQPEALGRLAPADLARLWPALLYAGLRPVALPAPADTPLAVQPGPGLVVLRAGFYPDAPVILFDTGSPALAARRWAHAGSFQVFHKGFLAATSAVDLGFELSDPKRARSGIGPPDAANLATAGTIATYSVDTVSANSIILTDGVSSRRGNVDVWPIYGGQSVFLDPVSPWWDAAAAKAQTSGRLLALAATPRLGYALADLQPAYGGQALRTATRELFFFSPDHLLVVDRLVPRLSLTQAGWLLQLAARPTLGGKPLDEPHRKRGTDLAGMWSYAADQGPLQIAPGQGRLAVQTLWPADAAWRISGGPGTLRKLERPDGPPLSYLGSSPAGFEYWCGTDDRLGGANAWFELVNPQRLGPDVFGVPHWGRLQVHTPRKPNSRPDPAMPILYVHLLTFGDRPAPKAEARLADANTLAVVIDDPAQGAIHALLPLHLPLFSATQPARPEQAGVVRWLDADGQPRDEVRLPLPSDPGN